MGTLRRVDCGVAVPLGLVGVFAVLVGADIGGHSVALAVDDLGELAAALWAGWVCLRHATRRNGSDRRSWLALAAAAGAWGAGEAVWSYLELVRGQQNPFPSLADIGFLAFVPLAIIGIVGFVRTPAGALSRFRGVLEASLISASLLFVSWATVLRPAFVDHSSGVLSWALSLSYPAGDLLTAAVALFAVTRLNTRRSPALVLVSLAAVALAVSDSAFAYLGQIGAYGPTQLVDTGWVLGFVLLGLAARSDGARTDGDAQDAASASVIWSLVPYALVLPALGMRVLLAVQGAKPDSVLSWSLVALMAALVANAAAVAFENHALTDDLEERVRLRSAQVLAGEQRFLALVQDLEEVVLTLDADLMLASASASAGRVLGSDPHELIGEPVTAFVAASDKVSVLAAVKEASRIPGAVVPIEFALAGPDGAAGPRRAEATVRNLLDEPAVRGLVVNLRDVTERRRLEDELRAKAFRDALTGLPNRALFLDRLEHALARSRRDGSGVALAMVDLDGFKTVNDSLGHPAGDELLRMVAERISAYVRANDTVARLGGDEYTILLESGVADDTASRLVDALREPFSLEGQEVFMTASIGLTTGNGTEDPNELIRQADTAMYAAKRRGRGNAAVYEPEMHRRAVERLELEADLKRALDRGQLSLHFQPTIELATGEVQGFEALLRWEHPRRGPVSPTDFIPLAEENGAIVAIGRWVMHEACRQVAAWQTIRARRLSIGVNVSAVQFRAGTVVDDVTSALTASGLDPQCLVVELTESVLIDEGVPSTLHELRRLGVRIAIDDFGTGYSSLAYLGQLPVDILKVDKVFVDVLGTDSEQADGVVRAIVELADSLKALTVAEGVESAVQHEALQRLGCHSAQGFLFARPMDPADAFELLHGRALTAVS